jgi:hypothetical protein
LTLDSIVSWTVVVITIVVGLKLVSRWILSKLMVLLLVRVLRVPVVSDTRSLVMVAVAVVGS